MESIRRSVRSALGSTNWLYRAGARTIDLALVVTRCGLGTYLALRNAERSHKDQAPVQVSFKNLLYPINVRPGTDDVRTIIDNIVREEWGNFTPDREPALMIDGGAYIGDSSAYFLSRFPGLKVVALEPDPRTFDTLVTNLRPYGDRVRTLNCGLYAHEGTVRFSEGETGSTIHDAGETEIAVTTLSSLLDNEQISKIDILKLDIEGAEESIFRAEPERWLERTDWLIIEFHSDAGQAEISSVLEQNGFEMRQFRSVWYCRRPSSNGHPAA